MDLSGFLQVVKQYGYPNEKLKLIASAADYDLSELLPDLNNELGKEGVVEFCDNAIEKLAGKTGMKIDLGSPFEEYVVVNIYPLLYDKNEGKNDVICRLRIMDSKILTKDEEDKDVYKTIEEIESEVGPGDWADYDEMMDHIRMKIFDYVELRCGFGVIYE